jgi:hypothetical protein
MRWDATARDLTVRIELPFFNDEAASLKARAPVALCISHPALYTLQIEMDEATACARHIRVSMPALAVE